MSKLEDFKRDLRALNDPNVLMPKMFSFEDVREILKLSQKDTLSKLKKEWNKVIDKKYEPRLLGDEAREVLDFYEDLFIKLIEEMG